MSEQDAPTIELTTIYLEMLAPPPTPPPTPPRSELTITRAHRIPVAYYRYLYDVVGEPWSWHDRRKMPQAELAAIVADDAVSVNVLYVAGVPAGYVELDARDRDQIEIAYFGIAPAFIGQRLGPYLLGWGILAAWAMAPRRLWVHTCSLDHPAAVACYLKAGFVEYRRETRRVPDPTHTP